jgi:large subunit ribosomal protein L1
MARHGKNYLKAKTTVGTGTHSIEEGVRLAKESAYAKFDETLEVAMLLGVDPRHADQMVRGTVVLPHGTGQTMRVLVFAAGEKLKEAQAAGADHVGGKELADKIQGGWVDFDAVVATPDMMKEVGRLGKVLGPRGLMPNPKTGTVTFDVGKAVSEIKAGKVEFRVDKTSIIHAGVGKVSFETPNLAKNAMTFIQAVVRARPSAAKGKYVRSCTLATTMGPAVKVDLAQVEKLREEEQ